MNKLYQFNGIEWLEIAKNGKDAEVDYDYILSKIPKPKDGYTPVKGKDYFDGKSVEFKLDDLVEKVTKAIPKGKMSDLRYHGGGLSKVSTDSTLTGLGTPASPLSVVGGGSSSGFQLPLTGVIGQQTFTWLIAPNALCVDGVVIQKVQQDGTINWTGTLTTVLSVQPNYSIFAIC